MFNIVCRNNAKNLLLDTTEVQLCSMYGQRFLFWSCVFAISLIKSTQNCRCNKNISFVTSLTHFYEYAITLSPHHLIIAVQLEPHF